MSLGHTIARGWRHLTTTRWALHRAFPELALVRIEAAVRAAEARHAGEICIALEASLPLAAVEAGLSPRQRAEQVFAQLKVWDTEHNNGVLVYLLWADRDIEILADRGVHAKAGEAVWADVCALMEAQLKADDPVGAVLGAVEAIATVLETHFPEARAPNERPDRPIIL
jgi:uncharacterized membrane protein